MSGRAAVFLDRDGTIIEDRGYLADPAGVVPLPGAVEALRALRNAGFVLVLISNQSGVARGKFSLADMAAVQARVTDVFAAEGIVFDGWYYCPHVTADGCDCRKPHPGLLRRAAGELGIDPAASFMVGDRATDILAGQRAGCRTALLIGPTLPDLTEAPPDVTPDFVGASLADAAAWIMKTERAAQ
jgi:histidinol-phosphate phosphatase family protein